MSVWNEVDAAGRHAEELRKQGHEVHFEINETTGKLVIQLREIDGGGVLRELSPSDAVAIAGGAPA
jgi:uncharacterized FlaG/YvyC family protein